MAVMLHAHVIVLVTTGRFSSTVFDHTKRINAGGPLQVVLVDAPVVQQYAKNGRKVLLEHFHEKAAKVLELKRAQVP
jgi:hypothetical protein